MTTTTGAAVTMTGMAPMTMSTSSMSASDPHSFAHLMPKVPAANDPRFIAGSVGPFGTSETIKQQSNPGFGGITGHEQNANDRKQNNFGVTDANFTNTWGVIADPDTGKPMTYMQTQQSYSAAGFIEQLAPDVYAKLVANQDAGKGTVLGGALSLLGITKASDPSLQGITDADRASIPTQLPGLGNVKDIVLSGTDYKGRQWNRAHHDGTAWIGETALVKQGFSWPEAALFTGDSMTSWSGRVIGSNNQDGDKTGFAADELAGLKFLAISEQATGKDILSSVLKSHADTHLPVDKLTDPKIFKLLGIDHKKGAPPTDAEIQAIRNFALQSTTQVDQGEFRKFLDKAPPELAQQIGATGLLSTVQFKPENHDHANGGGGGNNTANNEPTDAQVTGNGTGTVTAQGDGAVDTTGGGGTAPVFTPGVDPNANATAHAATSYDGTGSFGGATAAGATLGAGQLPVSATTPGADPLNALTNPVSTALGGAKLLDADKGKVLLDLLEKENDLNKAWVQSPRQQALESALKDGKVDPKEKSSLLGRLGTKGKALFDDLLTKSKDGTLTAGQLDQLTTAIAQDDTDAVTKALADNKFTAKEKADLKDNLSDARLKAIKDAEADGTITDAEKAAIIKAGSEAPKHLDAAGKAALEAAMQDGKLTAAERKTLEGKLSDAQQAVLDKFVGKDGTVSADAAAKVEGAVATAADPKGTGVKPTDPKAAGSGKSGDATAVVAPGGDATSSSATGGVKPAAKAATKPGAKSGTGSGSKTGTSAPAK